MQSSVIAMVIAVCAMICYATELIPMPVTAVVSCLAMSITGIISYSAAFSGFSSDTTMMVIGAMIMGNALFKTGAAQFLGKGIIKLIGNHEKQFIFTVVCLSAFLSAFLSNTAVVAMMIPVINSVDKRTDGAINVKNCLMCTGYAAVAGGACTLVGSTPQLIAQGVLREYGLQEMGFFDLAMSGIPKVIIIGLYFMTIGYKRMQKTFDYNSGVAQVEDDESKVEDPSHTKAVISASIMAFCVIGFVTQIWTVGTVAMLGGTLCILTGCISLKQALARMDWGTIIILGGSLGFASGLNSSGAGLLVANGIIALMGRGISQWAFYAAITLICILLGNIMSHTATSAAMSPIFILLAQELGIDPVKTVICMVAATTISYINPAATPPITMTMTAGYRFVDYFKVGWPLQVIMIAYVIITIPVFF